MPRSLATSHILETGQVCGGQLKSIGSEVRLPGFRFQLCDLRPVAKPL